MKEQHSETAGAVCTCVASKWHYPARGKKATQTLQSSRKGKNNMRSAASKVSPCFCTTQQIDYMKFLIIDFFKMTVTTTARLNLGI